MNKLFTLLNYIPKKILFFPIYFLVSFIPYFIIIFLFKVDQPDLTVHISFADQLIESQNKPAHPIFFILIKILSFFSTDYNLKLFACALIFSIAQYFTLYFSIRIIKELFNREVNVIMHILILSLQFALPIPFFLDGIRYNSLSMNYFHNGTLSASIPFAYGLCLYAFKFLLHDSLSYLKKAYYFALLLILTKPSFTFCFIPAFPIYAFIKYGLSPKLLRSLQLSIFMTFGIVAQSFYLRYYTPSYLKDFKIKFQPFFLYGSISNHVRIVLEGFLVGISFLLLYFRKIIKSEYLIFATLLVVIGYTISFTMIDYLNGVAFPNMAWQTTIVNKLAILFCIPYFIPANLKEDFRWKTILVSLVLLLHGFYGLYYLYTVPSFRVFHLNF